MKTAIQINICASTCCSGTKISMRRKLRKLYYITSTSTKTLKCHPESRKAGCCLITSRALSNSDIRTSRARYIRSVENLRGNSSEDVTDYDERSCQVGELPQVSTMAKSFSDAENAFRDTFNHPGPTPTLYLGPICCLNHLYNN